MRYNVTVNQKQIIDLGYDDLDFIDAAMLYVLHDMFGSSGLIQRIDKGRTWTMLKPGILLEQLPLFKLKKDTCYRRLKDLVEKGYVDAHSDNGIAKESWYAPNPKMDAIYGTIGKKSDTSDQPSRSSDQHPIPSDQNPIADIGLQSDNNRIKKIDNVIIENTPSPASRVGEAEVSTTPLEAEEKKGNNPPTPLLFFGEGSLQKKLAVFRRDNPGLYEDDMYREFLDYWTEACNEEGPNEGRAMWRTKAVFRIDERLRTWLIGYQKDKALKQQPQPQPSNGNHQTSRAAGINFTKAGGANGSRRKIVPVGTVDDIRFKG